MRKYDVLYKKGVPPSQSFTRQSGLQMFPKEEEGIDGSWT